MENGHTYVPFYEGELSIFMATILLHAFQKDTRIRLTSLQNYKIVMAKEVYRHALGQVSF